MIHDTNRPSNSSGGVAVVLALLLVGGIVTLGAGAFVWMRAAATQRHAAEMRAAEAARVEAAALATAQVARQALATRLQTADQQHPPDAELAAVDMIRVTPADGATVDVTIQIDRDGAVELHGGHVSHEELATALADLARASADRVRVAVWPDEACEFRHVAAVLRACDAAGVEVVEIAARDAGSAGRGAVAAGSGLNEGDAPQGDSQSAE